MSDQEKQEQEVQELQAQAPEEKTEINTDDKLKEMEERWKKEIAGLNRRNSELQKTLEEKELEKLNEEDKAKEQLRRAQEDKERIETEIKELNKSRLVDKYLHESNLPTNLAKRINGEDEETIQADVKDLVDFINAEVEKRAEATINERLGGQPPKSGATPDDTTLQAQYEAAKKAGNIAQCIAIKRAASVEGVEIKEY